MSVSPSNGNIIPGPGTPRRRPDMAFRGLMTLMCWVVIWFNVVPPGCRYIAVSYSGYAQMVWGTLIALALLVIVQRPVQCRAMRRYVNPGMVLFLGWCALSALWSPYRPFAFRQAVLMSGISLVALAFVIASWDAARMHRALVPAMLTVVVLSMVVALADPANGVEPGTQYELRDSWRGLAYQKNTLGQLAAVTLIFLVHSMITRLMNPALAVGSIAITVFVLLKSRSSTSLMLSLIASGIIMLQCRPLMGGRTRKLVLMPAIGLIVFPVLFYFVLGGLGQGGAISRAISGLFGKDITFSGRTEIWVMVNEQIRMRPWLGIGYQSFWLGYGSPSEPILRKLEWNVPSAHNGYIEIINAVGYLGFAIFLLFVVRHWRDVSRLMSVNRAHGSLHMAFFIYALFANLSESQWFYPGSFTHVIAVYSSMTVSRMLLQYELLGKQARRAAAGREAAGSTGPPPLAAEPPRQPGRN